MSDPPSAATQPGEDERALRDELERLPRLIAAAREELDRLERREVHDARIRELEERLVLARRWREELAMLCRAAMRLTERRPQVFLAAYPAWQARAVAARKGPPTEPQPPLPDAEAWLRSYSLPSMAGCVGGAFLVLGLALALVVLVLLMEAGR